MKWLCRIGWHSYVWLNVWLNILVCVRCGKTWAREAVWL